MAINSAEGKLLAYTPGGALTRTNVGSVSDYLYVPETTTDYAGAIGKETIATIRISWNVTYNTSDTYGRIQVYLYDGTKSYYIYDKTSEAVSSSEIVIAYTDEIKGVIIPPGYKIGIVVYVTSGGASSSTSGMVTVYGFEE